MSSVVDLPQSILRIILEYIPDPETLCNFDVTSKEIHDLVREDSLWTALVQQRWTVRNATVRALSTSRDEYKRRHMIDTGMIQCISRLKSTTEQLPMLYAFTHVMATGRDAMDICFKLWKNMKSEEARMFSRGLLRMLQCSAVCSDMIHVLSDGGDAPAAASPGERLENACILTTCMFRSFQQQSSNVIDTTAENVKRKMDDIAEEIRSGFSDKMSTNAKLRRVHEVFFDPDTGFAGNAEDYYDYRNSLLDFALEYRKAIPMTLVLLYKFICQRLDINVEVVGLPGHIVAYVSDLDIFVDVFVNGRHLTAADCAVIVTNFGYPMQASYLNPLPTELVVQRILNNLENCLVRHPTVREPSGPCRRAAVTALRAIASNPNDEQLDECQHLLVLTWVTEACVGNRIDSW